MKHHTTRSPWRRESALVTITLALAFGSSYALPQAQPAEKKALTVEDYAKWRSISGQEISGDGQWVTYGLSFTNTMPTESRPVLHLVRLDTSQDTTVPNATGGAFSSDSKWIAYQVDPSGGRGGRGGRGNAPGGSVPPGSPVDAPAPDSAPPASTPPSQPPTTPDQPPAPGQPAAPGQGGGTAPAARGGNANRPADPTRVELRNLATGAVKSWQDIQTFSFSANATYLILKRKPATPAGGGAGRGGAAADAGGGAAPAGGAVATTPAGPRGTDVILHNLTTGRDVLLGSVGDIAFNKSGELLAYTVDATVKDANGLFVLDLRNGRTTTLDDDARLYNRLTWSEDGAALAVLKGLDADKMRERDNMLIAFPNVQASLGDVEAAPVTLDPAKAGGFPKGWVVSDRAALEWSADDKRVFFGAKEQVPAPDTDARKSTDEQANVDIWNTADERIQSVQMIRADQDRNFTFREAFDVAGAKFVKLADQTMRDLDVGPDGRWAVGRDTRGFIHDYKRAAADIYRVNPTTGERTLMLKNQLINTSTGSHIFGISPDGHYFLYWKDNRFQAYDLDAASTRTLGGAALVSFVDTEFDHPGPRPAFGIAGYTICGSSRWTARPRAISRTAPARRATSGSATCGPSRSIR